MNLSMAGMACRRIAGALRLAPTTLYCVLVAVCTGPMAQAAQGIGTEQVLVASGAGSLAVRIWYPGDDGAVQGERLPLVVVSHGVGGDNEGHADTARALAQAGFVVAAVAHTGDTYRDLSAVREGRHLRMRPEQVVRTLDYLLTMWRAHRQIDARRIGMFGFSVGGFTALVVTGGRPELSRVAQHCRAQPDAWDCRYIARQGLEPRSIQSPPAWQVDGRIRAVVVAAPAVAYAFEPQGLAGVHVPVQLWGAARDDVVGDGAETVRRLLPSVAEYHVVDDAGHFAFLAPCSWALRGFIAVMHLFGSESICNDPAGFDRAQFHARFNAEVVRFFATQLPASP